MSRLQGKPYAQKVVESLDATERTDLLGLLNGSSLTPAFRSLTNASAYITDADEGVSHVSLETADGNLTGYLAYTDDYVALFAYERNSQGIAQYELDLDAMTIATIDETLDIEGLRTIVTDSLKADLIGGKVPAEQLPSYVDDVVEYEDLAHFPAEGEYGKIYIALDTGSTYRWGGTEYVQIGGSSATPMVSITWAELKALRDGGNLLPGQQYRITDYGFTTVTTSTSSAGHVFDIIVTAEDESHLEEEAFATHHAGDTYFANNKLEAWRLWYALDNDTTRFDWADATNGKGVVYRMIDEFGNDVPYDFKNCLMGSRNLYTFHNSTGDASLIRTGTNKVYDNVMGSLIVNGKQSLNKNYFWQVDVSTTLVYENTFGNDCYSIVCNGKEFFENKLGNNCHGLTFANTDNRQNTFGENCHDNTFGQGFYNNVIGNHFYSNTFGNGCYSNTFGNGCSRNNFGNGCYSNTFGDDCTGNELGNNAQLNTFGNTCKNNSIATNFQSNKIGNYFSSNTIKMMVEHNTFGDDCQSNRIGKAFAENFVENSFRYNVLGESIKYCTFGNDCESIKIGVNENTAIYVKYCHFDDGIWYVNLTSADDANASDANRIQNIHIHSGIKGDSNTPVSIVVPERGQSHSYDYYAANSVDVMI